VVQAFDNSQAHAHVSNLNHRPTVSAFPVCFSYCRLMDVCFYATLTLTRLNCGSTASTYSIEWPPIYKVPNQTSVSYGTALANQRSSERRRIRLAVRCPVRCSACFNVISHQRHHTSRRPSARLLWHFFDKFNAFIAPTTRPTLYNTIRALIKHGYQESRNRLRHSVYVLI
jgi:hypothetical protein